MICRDENLRDEKIRNAMRTDEVTTEEMRSERKQRDEKVRDELRGYEAKRDENCFRNRWCLNIADRYFAHVCYCLVRVD